MNEDEQDDYFGKAEKYVEVCIDYVPEGVYVMLTVQEAINVVECIVETIRYLRCAKCRKETPLS